MQTEIWLDLDGVLCGCVAALCEAYGKDIAEWPAGVYDLPTVLGEQPEWSDAFFAGLDWAPGGEQVYERAVRLVGRRNVHVVSRLSGRGGYGKIEWVREHMPLHPVDNLHFSLGLKDVAFGQRHRILVDDCDEEIDAWRAKGCRAVTMPRRWNRLFGFEGVGGVVALDWLEATVSEMPSTAGVASAPRSTRRSPPELPECFGRFGAGDCSWRDCEYCVECSQAAVTPWAPLYQLLAGRNEKKGGE